MTRARLTSILTIAALGVALLLAVAKNKGWSWSDVNPALVAKSFTPQERAPEDAIYAMLDASRAGDADAYLNCYTGKMKDQLKQSITEATPAGFTKYLRDSNAAVQGVALSPPEAVTDGQVKVRVEYVYKDRNEMQFVFLKREQSTWRIFQVDSTERVKTLVPFGAPVSD